MLSAGFQTLVDLKLRLMPDAGDEETEWDTKLANLGLGIAGLFNRYTGRTLERGTGVAEDFRACACAWTLTRYPVESIASIALVDPDGTSTDLTVGDFTVVERSGLVELGWMAGATAQKIRFTYTGGYWLDDGNAMPSGASAMPLDLLEAWITQVQHAAEVRGIFGDVGMRAGEDRGALAGLDLVPQVELVLKSYRRFGGE